MHENKFISKDGRTNIIYNVWHPENSIRGIIQLTHGVTEYMKNYHEFAEFLCAGNFLVIGHDQLGHGYSKQSSAELGHFINKDSVDILIDDMHTVMKKAKDEYPDLPYFLIGHSFGSFLTRIFAGKYGNELNGLILTGTGNAEIKGVNSSLKMIRGLMMLKKPQYRSSMVQKQLFQSYSERIDNPKNMHEWMCRDEKSVEDYLNDPLNNYVYTLNGFYTVLSAILRMEEEDVFESTPKKLPILMMSGSEDPVGDYTKQVLEVYDLYKEHEIEDITLKVYNGARHNILLETNKEEVMNDIRRWIIDRIS